MSLNNRSDSTDNDTSNIVTNSNDHNQNNPNRDPISGELGSHPLGAGVGAAGTGTVATVVGGVVGGPIGAVVGAVIGSVVGGLAGKDVAEQINPTLEDIYWRENYSSSPYFEKGTTYADYQTAYRAGYEGYDRYGHSGRTYSEIEANLQRDYEKDQTGSLPWEKAKHAVKDAWDRAALSFQQGPL
ncbi:hypothetical protein [Pseudanabaena sp. ABRG5-3]|uniref:hypothetical protein n=1 Tax=Pseudanabaena sp. ABRG5-3 TaxID=685565 RepID=UPI000DC70523|nr:hypothetical protein [Pseudanabaena sp. ABRG5-3]BBC26927.1 hypothetical protein ABRG53_c088 [Pseudanabaena sp. ABRG5-3]